MEGAVVKTAPSIQDSAQIGLWRGVLKGQREHLLLEQGGKKKRIIGMIKLHRIGKIAFGGNIGKGGVFFFLPSPFIRIWSCDGWRVCEVGFYFTQYFPNLCFAYNYKPEEDDESIYK